MLCKRYAEQLVRCLSDVAVSIAQAAVQADTLATDLHCGGNNRRGSHCALARVNSSGHYTLFRGGISCSFLREIIQPSMTLRPDRLFSLFTFLAVRPAPVTVCLAEIHATCLIPGSNLFSGSFQSQQKLLQAL